MRTLVGSKSRKIWRWLAVERASRRLVAWVNGDRSAQTVQRLGQALLHRYRRHC
ncbi:MAG: IS1 family transposase [Janthinobacterium lividum]